MFLWFAFADRPSVEDYMVVEKRSYALCDDNQFEFELPLFIWDILEYDAAFWRDNLAISMSNKVYRDFEIGSAGDKRRRRYLLTAARSAMHRQIDAVMPTINDNERRQDPSRHHPEKCSLAYINKGARYRAHRLQIGLRARQLVSAITLTGRRTSAPDWIAAARVMLFEAKQARQAEGIKSIDEHLAYAESSASEYADQFEEIRRLAKESDWDSPADTATLGTNEAEAEAKAQKLRSALTAAFFSEDPMPTN